MINRREFLVRSAETATALSLARAGMMPARTKIGFVASTHPRLEHRSSLEDPLDYVRIRDTVWRAIEYSGGFTGRIHPGSWVVIKPNIVFLKPQAGYRSGDITDFRVTKAVAEYVALNSRAACIAVAEGGSYRSLRTRQRTTPSLRMA